MSEQTASKRKYPSFYERTIPVAIWTLVVIIVIMLVITIGVGIGYFH
ncbi:MAG: hypothetical protein OEV06_04965 [Anaerolineae bacterium]|nr:hypothetical protein [Anaerolineae bacterium]